MFFAKSFGYRGMVGEVARYTMVIIISAVDGTVGWGKTVAGGGAPTAVDSRRRTSARSLRCSSVSSVASSFLFLRVFLRARCRLSTRFVLRSGRGDITASMIWKGMDSRVASDDPRAPVGPSVSCRRSPVPPSLISTSDPSSLPGHEALL